MSGTRLDPNTDPRTPHRIRHQLAREFLLKRYPGAHIQRVESRLHGNRISVYADVIPQGQFLSIHVPVPLASST